MRKKENTRRTRTRFEPEPEPGGSPDEPLGTLEITVEHSDATPAELFDACRKLIEEHNATPEQCGKQLRIPPGRARMIWHKVQTQIAIDHYGINKRELRASAVRSVVDRILQENASSEEPERQKVALQAAKLIMSDPFTGINDKAAEPDWDNIKAIGEGGVSLTDVISVTPDSPGKA